MKHISILLLHQVNLAGLENPRLGLLETNNYLVQQGKSPAFEVELIGVTPEVNLYNGLYNIQPDKLIQEVSETDVIVIPPVRGSISEAIKANSDFFSWIEKQYNKGAEVISLCLGAFILGSTGLIGGGNCVTHWRAANEFKALFPNVNLVTDKILTDENGIYTGGGAFSSANLVIYFIEKTVGREAAIYCSKIFQVDMGRTSQNPFIIFKGQKDHADEAINEAQVFIEENYNEKIYVNELSRRFGMGRRTFERRFKQATGNTALEYIQRVKVEAAKRELEINRRTVNEVMYSVGYSNAKAFRDIFKRYCGMSPIDYRAKFVQAESVA